MLTNKDRHALNEAPERSASNKSMSSKGCVWTTIAEGGCIGLPADFLEAIGVREGDPVQLVLDGDVVRIRSRQGALREIQTFVHRRAPGGVSLVAELLDERRNKATKDA